MRGVPQPQDERSAVVCEEITRTQIVQYAAASGDFSLLHTDEPAARAAGHPSVMAHGMMTMAMSSRVLTDWFGREALRTLDTRFTAIVWPGDQLTATATVRHVNREGSHALIELSLVTRTQDDRTVLDGSATVQLDVDETSVVDWANG